MVTFPSTQEPLQSSLLFSAILLEIDFSGRTRESGWGDKLSGFSMKGEGKMVLKSKMKWVGLVGLVLSAISLFVHFLLARFTEEGVSEFHSSITIFPRRAIGESLNFSKTVIALSPQRSHLSLFLCVSCLNSLIKILFLSIFDLLIVPKCFVFLGFRSSGFFECSNQWDH